MHRMSGLDAAFLYVETPNNPMHVVGVVVLEPAAGRPAPGAARIVEVLEQRLHLIPPFRRRMVVPPAGIDHPLWAEDPAFDVTQHVHTAALPAPVSWADLEAFTGEVAAAPLDRGRPLWELWVVEGLEGDRVALVTKLHHAIMDGGAGGEVMASLFDLAPDAPAPPPPDEPWVPDRLPSTSSLVGGSLVSLLARQRNVPTSLVHTLQSLAGTARTWVEQRTSGAAVPALAPRCVLNGAPGPRRAVSLVSVPLADLREIRAAFGTTVNDVVLAAAGTSLRAYLAGRDALPTGPLVVAVPVSARPNGPGGPGPGDAGDVGGGRGGGGADLGNRVSTMLVPLPLEPDDPVERLVAVHERARSAKALHAAFGGDSIGELAGFTAPAIMVGAARLYSGLRLANLHRPLLNAIVSNMPGPPLDLYCAGARVAGIFPMGPVLGGTGINITVLSQADHVDVGVLACPDLVPGVGEIAAGFVDAVAELRDRARSGMVTPG
jgi:WS/DGAT/MGAT family acyltransferase